MKILVSPLNWGLGHASRCIPLINRFLKEGNDVTIAGDGDSLVLLRQHFPRLRYIGLPELHLHYAKGQSQMFVLLRQLPHLLHWACCDQMALRRLLSREHFDWIISDNRFAFCSPVVRSTYITHQLHICLPDRWKRLEPLLERWHRRLMNRYAEVWVPDYSDERSLSGILSHPKRLPHNVHYIGPLSRFSGLSSTISPDTAYNTVLLLSGLEPQRTLLEQEIVKRYQGREDSLLVIQGRPRSPFCKFTKENITIVPYLDDAHLAALLLGAEKVIARSGYSSLMDFAALGILPKCELVPTPGQPEQEYLAAYSNTL